MGETPGPIPNPEAKTHSADGTASGRMWESRSPPDNFLVERVRPVPGWYGPYLFNPRSWSHGWFWCVERAEGVGSGGDGKRPY